MFKISSLAKAPTFFRSVSTTSILNVFSNAKDMAEIYQTFRPSCLYTHAIQKFIPHSGVEGAIHYALDIGCGTGASTFALDTKVSKKVIGIDPSPDMLKIAEKHNKNREKYSFILSKIEELDHNPLFQKQKFNLVTMANAFRLVNPKKCLQQIANVLADHGQLSIYYYTISTLDGLHKQEFEQWFNHIFLKSYPIVSHGKPFLPNPGDLHDFTDSTVEKYVESVPMDQDNLTGLLMSTSGIIHAVQNLKADRTDIQTKLRYELNPFFQCQPTVNVAFEVTILNVNRIPRMALSYRATAR